MTSIVSIGVGYGGCCCEPRPGDSGPEASESVADITSTASRQKSGDAVPLATGMPAALFLSEPAYLPTILRALEHSLSIVAPPSIQPTKSVIVGSAGLISASDHAVSMTTSPGVDWTIGSGYMAGWSTGFAVVWAGHGGNACSPSYIYDGGSVAGLCLAFRLHSWAPGLEHSTFYIRHQIEISPGHSPHSRLS